MDVGTGIFLGIVQGLTEFLPISSSGHLVFFQHLFGYSEPELFFDVVLHMGTLVAVCLYFRSDIGSMIAGSWFFVKNLSGSAREAVSREQKDHALLTLWVIVGTIPTALIGILFEGPLESLFGSVFAVGIMLVLTGIILGLTRFLPNRFNNRTQVGVLASLAVGCAQGIAVIPGISRSGATIVCGMLFKLERDLAARFSFLLSIPAILGAMLIQLKDVGPARMNYLSLLAGFFSSALVGLIALKILMGVVRKGKLHYFAPYCWALGLIIIILQLKTIICS